MCKEHMPGLVTMSLDRNDIEVLSAFKNLATLCVPTPDQIEDFRCQIFWLAAADLPLLDERWLTFWAWIWCKPEGC